MSNGSLNEKQINALFERGNNYIRMGNLAAAVDDYTQVIQHKPQFAPAYFNRGFARQHGLDDLPGAIVDYSRAIALNPSFAEAYANRGIARQQQGDYPAAIADFTAALEHAQSMIHVIYNNRGEAHFLHGKYDAAFSDFQQAHNLRDGYRYALAGMAICQWQLGHTEAASQLWKTLLERDTRFSSSEWVREEFGWNDALVAAAAGLIAALEN